MSDPERGAYTPPTDAPLSFDPREPVRGASPAPYALIISVLVLIAIAAAVFVFYRSGVRQAGQPPQVLGAPVGEVKTPPPADAQPQDAAAGLQIYRSEPGQPPEAEPVTPKFTPPPEQPQPRTQLPPVVLAPPSAALPAAPPAPAPAPIPKPLPVAPAAKVTPAPAKPASLPPKPVVAAPKPGPKTIDAALADARTKPSTAKAEAPKPAASVGGAAVQIGAFSSAALADKGWNDAARIAPGAAAGKGKSVEKIEKDGGALYRTAVTGFASKADATAFCDKLKAAGKSCFVR